MDALAGYGSDSGSDESNKAAAEGGGGGALSGLLAQYSDDSDDNEHETTNNQNGTDANIPIASSSSKEICDAEGKEVNGEGQPKKRKRRWDNPNEDITVNVDSVLPPPQLSNNCDTGKINNGHKKENSFQSMMLFPKDYTTELRQKLARQYQNQSSQSGSELSKEKQQLNTKLEQLHNKFHSNNNGSKNEEEAESFATHLKSQHEFGNPRLLKTIIEHFDISPLESHVGKNSSFKSFEYVDRLMSAEERARIAAANYHGAPSAGGMGEGA